MRGVIDDLDSPVPLSLQLPAIYQEDEFTQRFVSAFDVVLAPVLAALDDLAAYVDPSLAPDDFVEWLAGWVGLELSGSWGLGIRRAIVADAVHSYRRGGTAGAIKDAVALASGGDVEITESGGASWSSTPQSALPGDDSATMRVLVRVDDPQQIDAARLSAFVASVKPAHVAHVLEVVAR
ncbi:MAG: phage tail protein [Pseudonocardiales bacterium]|nr:MAG: phage tail protein [Pseudonocardiales bacterium]